MENLSSVNPSASIDKSVIDDPVNPFFLQCSDVTGMNLVSQNWMGKIMQIEA